MEKYYVEGDFSICHDSPVRLTKCGDIYEILYQTKISKGGCIQKIDQDHYIDLRDPSGEILNVKHLESRADDVNNVAKTLRNGRNIINANMLHKERVRWITLTYKKNVRDPVRIYNDFKIFMKVIRSKFPEFSIEYITAVEPQARGSWHFHIIMIFDKRAPFIENADMFSFWKKHGWTTVNSIDKIDNVGAYLTAYLADLDLDDPNGSVLQTMNEKGNLKGKRIIKGGRLHFYPPGMHIFRWSKGIKKPEVIRCSYEEAKKYVESADLTYKLNEVIEHQEYGYSNALHYEYYNTHATYKKQNK